MDPFEEVEKEYQFLDSVELDGETYYLIIPKNDREEASGEVFIISLSKENGVESFVGIENEKLFDRIYKKFKENNRDEFQFFD